MLVFVVPLCSSTPAQSLAKMIFLLKNIRKKTHKTLSYILLCTFRKSHYHCCTIDTIITSKQLSSLFHIIANNVLITTNRKENQRTLAFNVAIQDLPKQKTVFSGSSSNLYVKQVKITNHVFLSDYYDMV